MLVSCVLLCTRDVMCGRYVCASVNVRSCIHDHRAERDGTVRAAAILYNAAIYNVTFRPIRQVQCNAYIRCWCAPCSGALSTSNKIK